MNDPASDPNDDGIISLYLSEIIEKTEDAIAKRADITHSFRTIYNALRKPACNAQIVRPQVAYSLAQMPFTCGWCMVGNRSRRG